MPNARLLTILLASASLVMTGAAGARQNDQGKGPPGQQDRENKGQQQAAKHNHKHKNAHNILGMKLKQNGKHDVDKIGNRTVSAEVQNGKVKNMTAGDLPMKRVKTMMKMASLGNGVIPVPSGGGGLQFAQYGYDVWYYGYCFDDGYDFTCYWYPASDVDYVDYSWDDYYVYY